MQIEREREISRGSPDEDDSVSHKKNEEPRRGIRAKKSDKKEMRGCSEYLTSSRKNGLFLSSLSLSP